MNNTKKVLLGIVLLAFSPLLSHADTTQMTTAQKAVLIQQLYAQVAVLQQEIQYLQYIQQLQSMNTFVLQQTKIPQQFYTPVADPKIVQQSQALMQQQNCINSQSITYKTKGYDNSQAYVAAIAACPSN